MNEDYHLNQENESIGDGAIRERVLQLIMKVTMSTGMWKEMMRKLVTERPETATWVCNELEGLTQASEAEETSATIMGIQVQSEIAQKSDDPLHEELMARLDSINEDELLSCQSNALWVFRLMLQMGNLERALTAAEMDRSVFLRNITEALGYEEGEKFRIYNYLRRYEK